MNNNIYSVIPVIDYSVRKLCIRPYYNHPKGCPNYDKKITCPPGVEYIENIIDFNYTTYCIYNKFNFRNHVNNMRIKHPNWTNRQLECCLYWQGKARKQLKEKVNKFLVKNKDYIALYCPEACGVNITATMKQIGIILEFPPINWTYQVVIAGYPLKK